MTDTAARPNHVRDFLKLVAFEHSVFALPFAYLATLTVMESEDAFSWGVLALVTVAMVSGRTLAMAANRIIDRKIDARNPRTANRELV
ncbi:MAG TPA: UbiA family prenyltransferase, partial [Glycomyces sp.]|nr:UbiA family prenyltransferase [Glycomyces sp.]